MQFNLHHRAKSKSSEQQQRESHPTLNELEEIVNLPQNEWLNKLENLKWRGNERINIDQWKNILQKLKEPINALNTANINSSQQQISLIYAILNIYITLITHSSRHTMHNFDILSIDSLQKMIDLDDIEILMIVLDVWNVFWHRSGGTMQFEHQDLKKKIVGLCHNILQNEFTLPIPEHLQQITKMSSLSTPIHKSHLKQWIAFAQTIKIPKEYCKTTQIISQYNWDHIQNEHELRIAINKELQSLKHQISLPSEKEFVLKWRMYFAAHCNNLKARQNFIRLRIKALLVLSTFAQQYSSLLRDFLSDIDFAELSLELTELVELTVIPINYTTPSSPITPQKNGSLSPRSPTAPHLIELSIPTDIRISGLLCLKNFVFQVPIPFEQLRSIWEENSFVPATLRSIINDLDHEPESISTLKFASQFLNFLHSTITRTLPQMVGIHQFLDWNSMVQQVLTLISNKNIRDCSVLKESATLLYVILAKQRKPQTFIQFKGLALCFELIDRIMEDPKYLTNSIKTEYQAMKCMDVVHSSFSHHMIQQYTKQHLIAKLLECSMQSVRLSRQPVQYLRDPLVAKIMRELINKCYKRPKQTFLPSQSFTFKSAEDNNNNNNDDDDDTAMKDKTEIKDDDEDDVNDNNNDKIRRFAAISETSTPPPPSKRQKNKSDEPQSVLPIVPTPTEDYGHEVYQITCKMISVCIQNGAGLGVGKIFHEYGVTLTFVTSLTKQGVPNRSQVFQIVVESLRAICLYQPALDMIMQSGVIECLIRCFANPNYCSQLAAEAAGFFAKKMEELLRHNRKLQPHGIKAIVRTLKQLRNKPYLELQETYNSPIYYKEDIFPVDDDKEMELIRDPPKSKSDAKDIYPLFPSNPKIKAKVVYPEEPCFTGDNEAFWSAVTNIGKFLETSLKKFTQWEFVKNGGMDALVQLSYDPIMHTVATMKTKVFKEEKTGNEEEKTENKMKDVTTEVSAKFGSLVVPATNPKMTTAQKAVANSYPHIEDTEWPNLINKLLETFKVNTINDEFVKRFHYFTLNDVDGDLKELKQKHQELADALKTGSRITCLFSILTRLMRRADIKIIHKSKFYLFMKCLSDIIPGILWYMSCSDTNFVHTQANKLRTEILGLLSTEERKSMEENDNENDDDVDMIGKMKEIPKEIQDQYDGVFINIRYYECQVVSLMNHFTKFFKNALRIYRRSQDGRQRNQLLVQNNQNVVEYMSHMLHILIAFRAPLLVKGKNNEAVFDFWSITQFYEYVCHIIEAMAFTSHKTIVEGLIKSFIQYGGLRRIVSIFRYFVHCLNLTLDPLWSNQTNDGKAFTLSLDTENESNPLNSIIHGATQLFVKHEHDEDIKIRFCTESVDQKKKKEEEKSKTQEDDTSKHGMCGVTENLKSVVIQFYNFLYSLMKAGNVLDVHRDFRRYLAVELASLLKSPWIIQRKSDQYFKSTDFALIDKIVESTNQYITICTSFDIEYPPPEVKEVEEVKESDKAEMDVDKEEKKEDAKEDKPMDPARQSAINALLDVVPNDRDLVIYALDALQESAPNNVQVAMEWIFTHQDEWKKRKEAEAQQEKDATMNDDDEIKYYFKSIAKKEFGDAVIAAFLNDNEDTLIYLKSNKKLFEAPIYWQFYPLFKDVQSELVSPLIGLIDKIPSEDQEKWTFRPMSRPDQVEKLLKRIALLVKAVHKSIGDLKMKCYNKKVMWEEQQQASYKEMQQQKVKELKEAQEMRKAEILSKQSAKKEADERKKQDELLAEQKKDKVDVIEDNASTGDESYDEDEELRLAMEMSMMEQSDDNNNDKGDGGNGDEAEKATQETEVVPIDDGAPDQKEDKKKEEEQKEELFEEEYYDEDDVEETEEMRKLLVFPSPPTYKENQNDILFYSIKAFLSMFNTPRYPNNHAAAYCFAILQDAEPRTISIAQGSGLLQTVCGLIEECGTNLAELKTKNVDKELDEKTYTEYKTNIKKYQSLATTYYIIITGFLNKKAIRRLKENLLEDISRTHPHLYKNVSQQLAVLDKETPKKDEEKDEEKKKDNDEEDDDDDDDDDDMNVKDDNKDNINNEKKAVDDVDNDVTMATKETEIDKEQEKEKEPQITTKFELKKEQQTAKKEKLKLDEEAKKQEKEIKNKEEFAQLYLDINSKCDNIKLESSHKENLLASCLKLLNLFTWKPHFNSSNHSVKPKFYLRFQCEPNLLNRILTILSSITAEYNYAQMLLNNEGYKCILNCSTTSSSTTNSRTSAMATGIIRHMFDEPSLLVDAMQRQIKLSFTHLRKTFTLKQKSTASPFASAGTSEGQAFTQLFDPFMPLANFMASFKTLAARNETSFYTAVKNTCLIVRDSKDNLLISSRELLNKYALTLKQESKQNAKWESQDPRTIQWISYTDTDNLRIESVYQDFVNRFINGKLQNFHSLTSAVTVHFDGQPFNVDIKEYRQKNNSGGSRKVRRRRLNLEEKRKIALTAKKEKEEREKIEKEKEKKKEEEENKDKTEIKEEKQSENKKKSDKEEADDDEDGDVAITDNTNSNDKDKDKEMKSPLKSPSKSPSKSPIKVNKHLICPPPFEENKTDEKVLQSFEGPLNALMSIIVQTTEIIKDYCVKKRVEMKNDERERRIKKNKESEKEKKEDESKKSEEKDIDVDEDEDIEISDKLENNRHAEEKSEEKINELNAEKMDTDDTKTETKTDDKKLKIDDDDLEDALPSMSAMQTILGGSRLFAISDMLKILNDIIGNYPKFSGLVVNFNAPTTVSTTSFVQFMIEELIPYPTPLNETKNVVKPDKSIIASNLLKSIAGLNLEKNELTDQNATKLVLITLVKHIAAHSSQLYVLTCYNEMIKEPSLAPIKWNPLERMDKKLLKKHENNILEELYQVKSNLEVLREFVKTPSDRFCRFTARILTDSEVIDTLCRVLESKFDYGLSQNDVANNRLISSVVPHSVELKSNFLNPIAKLLHNICEIDSVNPIYNLLKSQRRKSRKRKSMDNALDASGHTEPTSPSLDPDGDNAIMGINDGIIRSSSDVANRNNVIQFISDISAEIGHIGDIQDVVIEFEVDDEDMNEDGVLDDDMVDSQDMNDESNINTEMNEDDDEEDEDDDDDDDDDDEDIDDENDENNEENDDEQDEDVDDDEDHDEDQYNDANLDRLYGQYAEDENDGFYDDEDLLENEYDDYGEEDIEDDDDDDDDEDNINVPTSVHRIANEFMDDLGAASDDFRQFFLRSQRFANIRRLDSILNGDDAGNSQHAARSGQPQIHFVNQNRGTGNNMTSASVFQIPPFDAQSLININNVSAAIPTLQPMVQMIQQQHNALLQQSGGNAQNSGNVVHYPPPPMNVHITTDLQQRYRLHHANRHGLHRIGQDVPQSSSTLFQRAFGDSPEARRPRSLMAIYRLIDRPTTSYFNSSDVQNELYNTSNTTISRHGTQSQTSRRNNTNAQNDIMNHFSRIQRFYDPPHRRIGGANNNTEAEQYRTEQQMLAQNVMRDYVNDNWSQITQNQITTESLSYLEGQFGDLAPAPVESAENKEDNVDTDALNQEETTNDTDAIIVNDVDANEPVPITNDNAVNNVVDDTTNAPQNITDQVSDLLRRMPVNDNDNNNNATTPPQIVSRSLDALTSQIFGMINNNNNNTNNNNNAGSFLEVIPSPANNEQKEQKEDTNDVNNQSRSMDVDQEQNQEETQNEQGPNPPQPVPVVEQKDNSTETSEPPSTEQKQDAATNAMDVDNNAAETAENKDNAPDNNNNNNDTDDSSAQSVLTRLEREIENNPIWNYSEMLNFDPDVILSLPEVIRNDIISPEFQNEVSTYLSMYQAQIAQRDIQQRRVEQESGQQEPQQPQPPQQEPQPVPSDQADNDANNDNKDDADNDVVMESEDVNDNVDIDNDVNAAALPELPAEPTEPLVPAEPQQPEQLEPLESKQDSGAMDVDATGNNEDTNTNTNSNSAIASDAAFAAALAAELNQQQPQPTARLEQNNANNPNAATATTNTNNTNNNGTDNNAANGNRNVIDPTVLAALPPDIQQEILREQQRNAVLQMTQNNEMDQATALLYYDPQTRMEMLMESNDATLTKLPPHLLAEAIMLRNRRGGYGMGGRWGFRRGARGRNRGGYGLGNDMDSNVPAQPTSAWAIAATERNNNTDEKKEEKDNDKDDKENKENKENTDNKDNKDDKDTKDNEEKKKPRKKRTPEEQRSFVIKKLCKEAAASTRNRVIAQYKAPIHTVSLKSLLKIMETSEVGHSELVLRGIFARLCKYQRLRLIIFNSLFDQLTFASPRYSSMQETAMSNTENRARLRRSLALIRYLMQGPITAQYLVKYMQLPTDYEIVCAETPSKKMKYDNGDVEMNSNNDSPNNEFDMSKCRILTLFSLFESPMLKNQNILQSFVETLSMLCKSNEMYLTHLQIPIDPLDIKHLVSLISDHIRCNDSIFTKLNNVAKSIMNVPQNKRSLTSQIIAESHNLSAQISKELDTIYKIIAPSRKSTKRLMKSWSITTKQNALLRNIEFLNKLISGSASRKFDEKKEIKKIKSCHFDANDTEIAEILKEKKDLHDEQLLLLTECSKGMEQLWIALDRCLEVFGYVPKDVLKKAIEKEEKEEKKDDKTDILKKELVIKPSLNNVRSSSTQMFTSEEEAMKAKMSQQQKILKKKTNKEEDARITSSVERLKPLIRAFFILHDFYSRDFFLKEKTPEELHCDLREFLASPYLISRYSYFLFFTDKHRNIFNLLIQHKNSLLIGRNGSSMSDFYPFSHRSSLSSCKYGAFASLIWHPKRVLDFDNKKMFLRDELKKLKQRELLSSLGGDSASFHPGRVRVCVRRNKLFADAFSQIKLWTKRELMSRLSVKFLGEDGVDAGGLTREFYQAMSREMFNADYSLFIPTNDNKCVFQPNINSGYTNPSHLDDFKFVGLMCAKAIYDEQVLDAYFTRSFLKHVLGIKPNWHDLQSLDFQHYKNLKWMINNPIDNVIFETFVANIDQFGRKKTILLQENGDKTDVTDLNKRKYVELICDFKMTSQIEAQITAFKEGLHILIPHWLISIFTWPELDLLICGMPDIDINDMMQNTEYHGGLTKNTQIIKWFWQCVQEMDKEERALLLQFITGTSKVPIGGFKALPGMDGIQRLQIHASNNNHLLPSAHTCFNQLDLPRYKTKQILKEKVMLAIRECSQGFGFS